jgi:hypothetical protein
MGFKPGNYDDEPPVTPIPNEPPPLPPYDLDHQETP